MSAAPAVTRKRATRRPPPTRTPWWGEGDAPHVRWPGATIEIPAAWSKERSRWESHGGKYYFDAEAADKACDFFPTFLTHHMGEHAGKAFELLPYQRALIVRPIFGWRLASDGTRRFRFLFGFIPKGNGKSPMGSGLGLYLTLCDGEAGAEVYAVAGDKEQAKVVHDSAKVMVEESADLSEMCEITRDSIYWAETRSYYKVLSSDAGGKHGKRPHGVIFDELHNQRDRELFEALRKSMMKRRQPLFAMFSHAGNDDESICFEEYEYAKRVLSGANADESYLPVVFEAGPEDDWTKPETWRKVNPGYGITISPDGLAAEARAAQEEPRKRNDFLMYNTNRWTGQAVAWIPVEEWDACRGTLDDDHLKTLACAAGLDMAQKIDLVAFAVTFREYLEGPPVEVTVADDIGDDPRDIVSAGHKPEARVLSLNFRMYVRPYFWLPEKTVEAREKEGVSYRAWKEAGLLTVTEGASIDYDRVYKDITEKIVPRYPLLKQGRIGYDPAFATDIAGRLRDKAGLQAVEVLQNYKYMNEPCHVLEALIKEKRVVHDGNRLMRWNVENVAVKRDDAGRIRPVKPRKNTKKIDGVVAMLMGEHCLMAMPDPGSGGGYNSRAERGEAVLRSFNVERR